MDLQTELTLPEGLARSAFRLLDSEAVKALNEVGKKLITREKIFLRRQQQGQAEWADQNPDYEEQKLSQFGTNELFVRTGRTKKGLTKSRGGSLFMRTPRKKRTLTIGLKVLASDGKNVSDVLQRGRFQGMTLISGRKQTRLSRDEVFDLNMVRSLQRKAILKGRVTGRSSAFQEALRTLQRGRKREWQRESDNAMPITVVMPGDESVATRVIREELDITMKKRGF